MKMLEKILLVTDFSDSSDKAADMAIEMARVFDSTVFPMHVIPILEGEQVSLDVVEDSAKKELDTLLDRLKKNGIKTETLEIKKGSVLNEILDQAHASDVNLIIAGSGKGTFEERFHPGTTAAKLIRKSTKPMFVVKHDSAKAIEKIFCPIDTTQTSRRALKNAIHIARHLKAELQVVTVVKKLNRVFPFVNKEKLTQHQDEFDKDQTSRLEAFLADFDFTDVTWTWSMVHGDPAIEILSLIRTNSADLIIMGSVNEIRASKVLIGSTAEKIARDMPVSMLTVKAEDPIHVSFDADLSNIQACALQGGELLHEGLPQEAMEHFQRCIDIDMMFAPAWEGLSEAHSRVGHEALAKKYKERAKKIREEIWEKRVELEVRGRIFSDNK